MSTGKKVLSFMLWGLVATVINVGCFAFFRYIGIPLTPAVIMAWFIYVTFSFFANKGLVFQHKTSIVSEFLKSMLLFYGSRAFSGLMDVVLMNVFVKMLGWNELASKLINEVLVSTFNFFFCFLVVFRKKNNDQSNR